MTKQSSIRAVVLLSGGMDSCVCAAIAAREHGSAHVAALHISYGQRTERREQEAFKQICDRLGIRRRLMVRNDALKAIGGSALTDARLDVPEAREVIGGEVTKSVNARGIVYARDALQCLLQEVETDDELVRDFISGVGYR